MNTVIMTMADMSKKQWVFDTLCPACINPFTGDAVKALHFVTLV